MRWRAIDTVYGKEVWVMMILAVLVLAVGVVIPLQSLRPCTVSESTLRQSRMRMITAAVRIYASDHDGYLFPSVQWHAVMDSWLGIDQSDQIYVSGIDSQFYLIPIPWADHRLPNGLDDRSLRNVPFLVAEQHLEEGRTSVAFWDGSVRELSDKEFAEKIDLTNAVPIGRRVSREDDQP